MMLAAFAVLQPGRELYAGPGFLFRVSPPKEWKHREPSKGILAEFVSDESRLSLSVVPKAVSTAESLIDAVLNQAKGTLPGAKVASVGNFDTDFGDQGFLFIVAPETETGRRFFYAFFNTPKVVVSIRLDAPDRVTQTSSLGDFAGFAKSFGFVTDKVRAKS